LSSWSAAKDLIFEGLSGIRFFAALQDDNLETVGILVEHQALLLRFTPSRLYVSTFHVCPVQLGG